MSQWNLVHSQAFAMFLIEQGQIYLSTPSKFDPKAFFFKIQKSSQDYIDAN